MGSWSAWRGSGELAELLPFSLAPRLTIIQLFALGVSSFPLAEAFQVLQLPCCHPAHVVRAQNGFKRKSTFTKWCSFPEVLKACFKSLE